MKNSVIDAFNPKITYLLWIVLFLFVGALALTIQLHLPIHSDNIFFLSAAKKLLAGGSYTHDFLEPNPPLIILMNVPIIWLASITSFDIAYIFNVYILFFSLASSVLSCYLLKKIIENKFIFFFTAASILVSLLILPNVAFGQREHLWVVFSVPYLLLAGLRLSNQKQINPLLAMIIGIFAGLGFALKPFFIPTFILLELFFIYKKRNIFAWLRLESISALSVMLIYVGVIYQFFSDYIWTVTPLLMKYYNNDDLTYVLLNIYVIYSLFIFISYGLQWKKWSYPLLSQLLMLAYVGSLLAHILSPRAMFYHILPMISFATILAVLFFAEKTKKIFSSHMSLENTFTQLLIWLMAVLSVFCLFPIEDHMYYLSIKNYQIQILILALLSILFFNSTLQNIIKEPATTFFLMLTLILALSFSAAPFPQLEQLYFILMIPYVCGILLRVHNQPVNNFKLLIISITLGVAIHVDYYLLIPVLFLEFFYCFKQKSVFAILRIELITALLLAYGLSANLLNPILTLTKLHFHWIQAINFIDAFLSPPKHVALWEGFNFYFCCFVLVLHFLSFRKARHSLINNTLFFALIGFLIFGLIEAHHSNLYATLPAVIIACLLIIMITGDVLTARYSNFTSSKSFKNICNVSLSIIVGILLLYYPIKFAVIGDIESIESSNEGPGHALSTYLNAYPNSTFDYLALDDGILELNMLTKHQFVGKYSMLWWYNAIVKKNTHLDASKDKEFFINGLADKLNQAKPRFMIVQLVKSTDCTFSINKLSDKYKKFDLNERCNEKIDPNPDFNFAKIFSQNKNFKKAWSHYKFLTDVEFEKEKYYRVYERI